VTGLCEKQPAAVSPGMLAARLDREANLMAIETSLGLLERAGLISVVPSPEPELKVISMQDPQADLSAVTAPLREKAERDHSRLRRLLRYVDSRTCRHATILRYFGDPAHRELARCRQCDNCQQKPEDADLRPPDEEEWVEIQKALSCVARLHGRFGRARICQVLAGSRDKAVLAVGLEKLPTYGALAGRSQNHIRELIDALADRDCIKTVGDEYPTLKITPYGREVMHRREEIELVWPKRREPKKKAEVEAPASTEPAAPGLVDALRAFRTRLARERKIPPYLILHNKTLEEIARRAPRDQAGLLEVPGIGPAKLADIGEEILEVIKVTSR
jgi:ATP-dependent DNA helicase RecQ